MCLLQKGGMGLVIFQGHFSKWTSLKHHKFSISETMSPSETCFSFKKLFFKLSENSSWFAFSNFFKELAFPAHITWYWFCFNKTQIVFFLSYHGIIYVFQEILFWLDKIEGSTLLCFILLKKKKTPQKTICLSSVKKQIWRKLS